MLYGVGAEISTCLFHDTGLARRLDVYLNLLSRERKTGRDPLYLHVVIVLCGVIFFQRRNLQSTTHDACSDRASTE